MFFYLLAPPKTKEKARKQKHTTPTIMATKVAQMEKGEEQKHISQHIREQIMMELLKLKLLDISKRRCVIATAEDRANLFKKDFGDLLAKHNIVMNPIIANELCNTLLGKSRPSKAAKRAYLKKTLLRREE